MDFVGGSIGWRLPVAVQIIPAIIISIVLFGLPETPRYLIANGKVDEAVAVMCHVYDATVEEVQDEKNEILESLELERQSDFKWTKVFKKDRVHTGRRIVLAVLSLTFNQVRLFKVSCSLIIKESCG